MTVHYSSVMQDILRDDSKLQMNVAPQEVSLEVSWSNRWMCEIEGIEKIPGSPVFVSTGIHRLLIFAA